MTTNNDFQSDGATHSGVPGDLSPDATNSAQSKKNWLSQYWLFWLVLAFIVYETTSQPAWAILIACIKVGFGEFATAAWLMRIDPDRIRVLPKALMYISHGLWKIAITGCLVGIGVMLITSFIQPNGGPVVLQVMRGISGAFYALFVGFFLSTFFTLIACLLALASGGKLYVGSAVDAAMSGRYWPPVSLESHWTSVGLDNFARWLILTAFLLVFGVAGAVIMNKDRRARNAGVPAPGMNLRLACLGLGCLGAYLYLNAKVVARRAEDSWQLPDWAFLEPKSGESQPEMLTNHSRN